MFDRYVSTKMTTCEDPYRELELYLEQAREEIGKAIKELEEDSPYLPPWNETVLPPPQAFRSTTPSDENTDVSNYSSSTVNRICHDGSLVDVQKNSNESLSKKNNAPFSASFNSETLGSFKKSPYSPNTRRRLWRMHPSISFPETTKDLRLLGKDSKNCNCCVTNAYYSDSSSHKSKSSFNSSHQHIRQRSASDTTVSCSNIDGSKDDFGIPKPPTGDFNLLSVWANNLVLELDKTLSGEFSSTSRWSPSSDYSLSPTKAEEISESDANVLHFESLNVPETELTNRVQISRQGRTLKSMSLSPDSGIEHSYCEITDCVDSGVQSNVSVNNCDLIIPVDDVITPPPPEFGDDDVNKFEQYLSKRNSSNFLLKQGTSTSFREFHAAVSVLESQEATEVLFDPPQDIKLISCVIAPRTVELEDCPVSRTTCTLNDVSHTFDEIFHRDSYLEGRYIIPDSDTKCCISDTTKYQSNSDISDKWRYTFPRDSERKEIAKFQRSISDPAVTNINLLRKSEPISWIRRRRSRPPSSADVGVDAKENQDAVTQTTPVALSRSSSLTWVTECNCSDWELDNINSGSEESVCSNCKKERRNRKSSSSSSLGISSDDDDFVPATTTGSGSSSSLYLSACSGSSDSFELIEDLKQTVENEFWFPSCYSESTLRASNLGDIYEEHMTSDSFSIKSTQSNPFLIDSNTLDSGEQPASFPSTLKITKKCPSQPIESMLIPSSELNLKSVSAPVLLKQKRRLSKTASSPPSDENVCNQVPARSQSAKELNELQAIESCCWLRAAGFPQYAQMYEDNQFPIDISMVQKDHAFLPQESLQSLFRRLNALNRCANMKYVDLKPRKSLHTEDSEEEEQYALSENWEFQRSSRRWSRITATSDGVSELVVPDHQESSKTSGGCFTTGKKYLSPEEAYCSSHDSVFVDEQHSSPDSLRRTSVQKPERIVVSPNFLGDCSPGSSSGSGTLSLVSDDVQEPRSLRRSGSDRVKEGAKALLKRMESLKGKRKKKGRDSKKVESDGSSSSSLTSSPQFRRCQKLPDSLHDANLQRSHKSGAASYYKDDDDDDDTNAHSDSECHMVLHLDKWKDANRNAKQNKQCSFKMTLTPTETSMKSKSLDKRSCAQTDLLAPPLTHSSFSKNQDFGQCDKRGSYYDNICAPIVVFNDFCDESFNKDSGQMYDDGNQAVANRDPSENEDKGEIIIINNERRDSGVGLSLTRGLRCIHAPWHCFPSHTVSDAKFISYPVKITELTVPQMLLLRKLSLLKLTAVMERFSPSNRTGWSWAVPKFIRRIRSPDYKDKNIFGVPLLLILQRTGQPMPHSIQAAFHYLQTTSLDSTGLFRKSGVKSRIQKLKSLNESNPENITYEGQQAYDVADMIKQYFRELPEALLTNKLSETFISIFQFIPEDLRLEAIQAALFLMPDENREVLQVLLEFLFEICQNSEVNQMSATNLAVCIAPSIFHLSSPRSSSSSPRRRKTVGVPDVRELNENRAAYECLSCMVSNYETLFSVSEDMVAQSRIASAAFSQAVTIDEISSFIYDGQMGLKGYVDSCVQVFLKEAKEKYKNYVSFSQYDHVDISYKKLSDGHPLRVWKVSTEVEAPPSVLLNRLLRERHLWDPSFLKSKIIAHLSNNTEVFQYMCSQLPPHPHCDFCVLRSWRTDLPRGACILIETSVNHPDSETNAGSVKALALVSRYLIEPCGSGKSRITHLSRVDFRGRSPEWYNRAYGHICTLLLIKLRASFSHACTDGPETKL